ncbi:MAG: hypothetical protein JRN22_03755, partial [Nitrososphaerota archaeon]|nr:hypothetical protein [Nitrososphaerota archaeon]
AAEMAKAMGNRDLANTLVALPNWVCVVRRNPVGGGGLSEIFVLRMPKVPGPSKSTEAVFEEARRAPWGGAEEDRHVSYRDAIESEMGMMTWTPVFRHIFGLFREMFSGLFIIF